MKFSVFVPSQAGPRPVLFFLAGLTATEETFAIKAGAQRVAAELGLILVSCDTSPRNTGIAGATDNWDFGEGAGFYLDATEAPWRDKFRMETYVVKELGELVLAHFPAHPDAVGIFGHSMGGHGALTLALKHRDIYRSVSAFAPIASASTCAWGRNAFPRYLGGTEWPAHDASLLVRAGGNAFPKGILVDQGMEDNFLKQGQLRPESLEAACAAAGQPLTLRRHAGYDHGYFFVSTFMEDHLRFHHANLA